MLGEKRRASAGRQATDEAQDRETLRARKRCPNIAYAADTGNQHDLGDVCLDQLLAEFVALNRDRYYPELHTVEDTLEPVAHSIWQLSRSEVARWAALIILKSPVHPPLIGDIIVETAQMSAVETGHYD